MAGSNYKQSLARARKQLRKQLEAVARDVAEQVFESVVILTPVDTTRAEANWNAALNTVPEDFDEGRRNFNGQRANIERAERLIQQMKLGDTFVAANATPYIIFLENGWSKQAPSGMVAVTAAMFPRMVKKAVERVKQRTFL